MIRFFKQSKGITSKGMPSKLPFSTTIAETKVDGSYVQIHKVGKEVRMFTSGGKEFHWEDIATTLIHRVDGDVMLEAEYIGTSEGAKGDRVHASLTSYIASHRKGNVNYISGSIVVFDLHVIVGGEDYIATNTYRDRLTYRESLVPYLGSSKIHSPRYIKVNDDDEDSLRRLESFYRNILNLKGEGMMLKDASSTIEEGKRRGYFLKVKNYSTSTLTCVGIQEGKGKYEGKIGSLILEDEKGISCKVSPRGDANRDMSMVDKYLGSEVPIKYECFIDTYIQPILMEKYYETI